MGSGVGVLLESLICSEENEVGEVGYCRVVWSLLLFYCIGIKGKMGWVGVVGLEERGKLGHLNWKAKKREMSFWYC